MKVFVTGASGLTGRSVIDALQAAGHKVLSLARHGDDVEIVEGMDTGARQGTVFDRDNLAAAFDGCDVVCNLVTQIQPGKHTIRPGAWKANDRVRAEGSRLVAAAAQEAGVARLIQESVSFLYADSGDSWIDEDGPITVTRAAEPVVMAESNAQRFAGGNRSAVVLRFGNVIGDDASVRSRLPRAGHGHPVGMGRPESWTHVVHPSDIGTAVVCALVAPSGTYNVGAEPIRRADLVAAFCEATGHDVGAFYRRLVLRLGGERVEWMTRSQRVTSARFVTRAGWKPTEPQFSQTWLSPLSGSVATGE